MSVLVLDRASFPSDTLSTHQVQLPGIARLQRWGLLDRLASAGTPATRTVRFDTGQAVLRGTFPRHEGVDVLYSPRRTLLDAMLVQAAREAGAEVRTDVVADELCWEDGTVSGVRGRTKSGSALSERARVVVGADGKHSLVARAAGAPEYRVTPPLTAACYTYWAGLPVTGGEVYTRERRAIGVWPTNDGLVMTYVALPIREFETARRDLQSCMLAAFDLAGGLGERVRAGQRAERVRATTDLPNAFRRPHGPGWALVGDAGLVMDPISGQGIADAFRDAELLSEALELTLSGRARMQAAMSRYERARNRAARPMFDFTTQLARLAPPTPAEQRLFAAIAEQPAQVERFFGVLTGAVAQREFFAPGSLVRLVGARGIARLVLDKARANRANKAGQVLAAPTSDAEGSPGDQGRASPWKTASTLLPSRSRTNTP
jgi:2-polyprenyl-6-methoxyphenol hydroxylase-like FAD-dependent oxidoreductase